MANLYTKTGDKGQTSLFGGKRVEKNNLRVECYGTIDEAISMLGLAYSQSENENVRNYLNEIQRKLFIVGAELASDEKGLAMLANIVNKDDIKELENIVDECTKLNGKQTNFIVPGKNQPSSSLHVARTIIRRAERNIVTLKGTCHIREELLRYVNRLSDTIYALARLEETYCKINDIKDRVIRKLENIEEKDIEVEIDFNLENIIKMADYAKEKATQMNVPIVFSAVDSGGNLILLHRMEDSLLASINISTNKAYTANSVQMPTHELGNLCKSGDPLYGLQYTNDNKIIIFGGGYPIKKNGKVVGGIGVSGGSVEQDMEIAFYAIQMTKISNN
ncbi:MAG: cob(I)yrinic acid a,c-diamide adenosyltransferase [Romboutsia sp.]|uniref:cob(I)yrinic acid a,c-diamide adenosyltransferase n=1 Tax=Romboutsia sp. TaxID=1965302 RepID=UPI003F2CB8DD